MSGTGTPDYAVQFSRDDVLNLLAHLEWLAGVNALPYESTKVRENAANLARMLERQTGLKLEAINLRDVSEEARKLRERHLSAGAPAADCKHVPSLSGRCLGCGLQIVLAETR